MISWLVVFLENVYQALVPLYVDNGCAEVLPPPVTLASP
jgi:hypothetical protein